MRKEHQTYAGTGLYGCIQQQHNHWATIQMWKKNHHQIYVGTTLEKDSVNHPPPITHLHQRPKMLLQPRYPIRTSPTQGTKRTSHPLINSKSMTALKIRKEKTHHNRDLFGLGRITRGGGRQRNRQATRHWLPGTPTHWSNQKQNNNNKKSSFQ